MANPPPYVPSFSFSGYQETNPTSPLPGPMVDNELDNIANSLGLTITALSSVRRSDGALVNGIVTPESLSSDLTIGVQTPTAWVTAHAYTVGNIVVQSNKFYLCVVSHTSGVFATDLPTKWTEVTLSITGYSADQVTYDNAISGLLAVNVKTALDEINAKSLNVTAQTLTAAQQAVARANISAALKGQLFGLALTTNAGDATNDIDIAVGEAASSEANPVLMVLASALGKRLDATWVVGGTPGATVGGLDTGVVGNSTYYAWLIRRSDTGVVDALFSLSSTAPTMPASYDQKQLIGQVIRVGGVNDGPLSFSVVGAKLGKVQATISGTTKTYTFPAGVKKITILLESISTGGTNNYVVTLGDAGGLETAGYLCGIQNVGVGGANSTTAFLIAIGNAAASVSHGIVELRLLNPATNLWVYSSTIGRSNAGSALVAGGSKALSAELTQLEFNAGGDTFDLGSINVQYE
jgi:hypothetical protein